MIDARSIDGTVIESAPNLSRQESFSCSAASAVKPVATRWSSLRASSIERIWRGSWNHSGSTTWTGRYGNTYTTSHSGSRSYYGGYHSGSGSWSGPYVMNIQSTIEKLT
jgi:hypothetical protein